MSYSTQSRLAQAEALHRVEVVPMNKVKFLPFTEKPSIGTRDLAGCSVVVIASIYGAILAHIPPRPIPNTPGASDGDRNVARLMAEVESLFNQNKNFFPEADTYSIVAVYGGQIALPDQKEIIESKIGDMGLKPFNGILYVTPRDPTNSAHGTVFVDAYNRGTQKPLVYTEDRLVSAEQPQSSWTWSDQYKRHYRIVNGQYEWN
jgi:hypothetical protein